MEAQCQRSMAFDCTPQPAACCSDWMAGLPDALPLSCLSIPGTHDSLSLFGGRRLRCQSWGLEAQLAAGIRFLDVRCKLVRGELQVYHLCTFQRASLRGVLRRTLRFLRAHPSEAVLMRIKEELPIFSQPGFAAQLRRCLLEEGQGHVWCQEEVPTLGQVRGKIVVLEALAQEVLGIPYEQLSISDAWNVLSLERKWARAQRHLERVAGGDTTTMHLTFCSGNGLFTYPEEVARFVNPRCYQHLQHRRGQPVCWGVIIMDFPGAGLVQLIVESNSLCASGRITASPSSPPTSPQHHCSREDRCHIPTASPQQRGWVSQPAQLHSLPAPVSIRTDTAPGPTPLLSNVSSQREKAGFQFLLGTVKPLCDNSVTAPEAAEEGWQLWLEPGSPGSCPLHAALPQGARGLPQKSELLERDNTSKHHQPCV